MSALNYQIVNVNNENKNKNIANVELKENDNDAEGNFENTDNDFTGRASSTSPKIANFSTEKRRSSFCSSSRCCSRRTSPSSTFSCNFVTFRSLITGTFIFVFVVAIVVPGVIIWTSGQTQLAASLDDLLSETTYVARQRTFSFVDNYKRNSDSVKNWTRQRGLPFANKINARCYTDFTLGYFLSSPNTAQIYRQFADGSFHIVVSTGGNNNYGAGQTSPAAVWNASLTAAQQPRAFWTPNSTWYAVNVTNETDQGFFNFTAAGVRPALNAVAYAYGPSWNVVWNTVKNDPSLVDELFQGSYSYELTRSFFMVMQVGELGNRIPGDVSTDILYYTNKAIPVFMFSVILREVIEATNVASSAAFVVDSKQRVIGCSRWLTQDDAYNKENISGVPFATAVAQDPRFGRECFAESSRKVLACLHNISTDPTMNLLKLVGADKIDLIQKNSNNNGNDVNSLTEHHSTVLSTDGVDFYWIASDIRFSSAIVMRFYLFIPVNVFLGDILNNLVDSVIIFCVLLVFGCVCVYLIVSASVAKIEVLAEKMYRDPFAATATPTTSPFDRAMNSSIASSANSRVLSRHDSSGSIVLGLPTNGGVGIPIASASESQEKDEAGGNNKNDKNNITSATTPTLSPSPSSSTSSSSSSSSSSTIFDKLQCLGWLELEEISILQNSFAEFRAVIDQLRCFLPRSEDEVKDAYRIQREENRSVRQENENKSLVNDLGRNKEKEKKPKKIKKEKLQSEDQVEPNGEAEMRENETGKNNNNSEATALASEIVNDDTNIVKTPTVVPPFERKNDDDDDHEKTSAEKIGDAIIDDNHSTNNIAGSSSNVATSPQLQLSRNSTLASDLPSASAAICPSPSTKPKGRLKNVTSDSQSIRAPIPAMEKTVARKKTVQWDIEASEGEDDSSGSEYLRNRHQKVDNSKLKRRLVLQAKASKYKLDNNNNTKTDNPQHQSPKSPKRPEHMLQAENQSSQTVAADGENFSNYFDDDTSTDRSSVGGESSSDDEEAKKNLSMAILERDRNTSINEGKYFFASPTAINHKKSSAKRKNKASFVAAKTSSTPTEREQAGVHVIDAANGDDESSDSIVEEFEKAFRPQENVPSTTLAEDNYNNSSNMSQRKPAKRRKRYPSSKGRSKHRASQLPAKSSKGIFFTASVEVIYLRGENEVVGADDNGNDNEMNAEKHKNELMEWTSYVAQVIDEKLLKPTGAHLIECRNNTFLIALRLSTKDRLRTDVVLRSRLACRFVTKLTEISEEISEKRNKILGFTKNNNNNTGNHRRSSVSSSAKDNNNKFSSSGSAASTSTSVEDFKPMTVQNLLRRLEKNRVVLTAGFSAGECRILRPDSVAANQSVSNNNSNDKDSSSNNKTSFDEISIDDKKPRTLPLRPLTILGRAVGEAIEAHRAMKLEIFESECRLRKMAVNAETASSSLLIVPPFLRGSKKRVCNHLITNTSSNQAAGTNESKASNNTHNFSNSMNDQVIEGNGIISDKNNNNNNNTNNNGLLLHSSMPAPPRLLLPSPTLPDVVTLAPFHLKHALAFVSDEVFPILQMPSYLLNHKKIEPDFFQVFDLTAPTTADPANIICLSRTRNSGDLRSSKQQQKRQFQKNITSGELNFRKANHDDDNADDENRFCHERKDDDDEHDADAMMNDEVDVVNVDVDNDDDDDKVASSSFSGPTVIQRYSRILASDFLEFNSNLRKNKAEEGEKSEQQQSQNKNNNRQLFFETKLGHRVCVTIDSETKFMQKPFLCVPTGILPNEMDAAIYFRDNYVPYLLRFATDHNLFSSIE